jgi:serine/threonine protein kinase
VEHIIYIDKKKPSFEKKISFIIEIATGMNFLHTKNIIHRDLKCENILINEGKKIFFFFLNLNFFFFFLNLNFFF